MMAATLNLYLDMVAPKIGDLNLGKIQLFVPRDFKSLASGALKGYEGSNPTLVSRPIAQWQTRHNRTGLEPGGVERFELPTRKLHPQSSTHKHLRFGLKARINSPALRELSTHKHSRLTPLSGPFRTRDQNQVINSHLPSNSRLVRATLSNSDQLAFNQLLTVASPRGFEPLSVGVAGMKTRCYSQKPVDTCTYPRINTTKSLRINTTRIRDIHALTLPALRINTTSVVALAQSSKRLQRCSCSYFLYLLFLYLKLPILLRQQRG